MFLAQFATVAVVHLFAVMSPGPDFAMVTRNSLIYSRKVGVYTSLGIALGIMIHVAYSLLGIALLISKSILVFNVIKYIGAAYLIYIGYKSLRAKPQTVLENEEVENWSEKPAKILSPLSSVYIGFLTNVLNPKATLFFLALFTQIIIPDTPQIIQFFYGIEMTVITFVWFTLVSILFSSTLVKAKIKKVQHYVERVTGAVLIALGVKVALSSQN